MEQSVIKNMVQENITNLFLDISENFKNKTNCKKNYIEYISSLLYLKYADSFAFERIYKERKNYYSVNLIDDTLEELRRKLHNPQLFANIRFQNIKITRPIGEENVLIPILEELYLLEQKKGILKERSKEIVAGAYERLIEICMQKKDILNTSGTTYTPKSITNLLASLIVKEKGVVFDPYCGTGNFLLSAYSKAIEVIGLEQEDCFYNICMTNLFLHDINNANIFNSYELPTEIEQNYDIILSNPPFSQKDWASSLNREELSLIHEMHLPLTATGDYAFVIRMLDRLKMDGKMAVILPQGVLFRNNEKYVRKYLIQHHYLEAIIGLPEKLFYDTKVSVIILVLTRQKIESGVLFIDASKCYESDKTINQLTKKGIEEISKTFHKKEEKENFSYVASLEEIEKNDYNLTIKRYIKEEITERVKVETHEILTELEKLEKETNILEDNINDVLGSLGLSEIFLHNKKEMKKKNNEINYKKIGETIRDVRKEKGYTQSEIAEEANITRIFLASLESGKSNVNLITLSKICDALGISLFDILK